MPVLMSTFSLDIPPRSRLCNLEPIGIGTSYVECLSGYAARLAAAHSSTVYYLFSREVAPLINKPGTISLRVSFPSFSKSVNGLGTIAADLVKVFERLTLRQDLGCTTMLPWATALSSKSLTRKERAWCPSCYEDCASSSGEVHDQLIWSVQCVTACARHERWLENLCPNCRRQQISLSHRIRPGFCGRCRHWLGSRTASGTQVKSLRLVGPGEEELRGAEEVGKLIALAPEMLPPTAAASFTRNLKPLIGKMFMGRGMPTHTQLPADKQTLLCWLKGTQTPSLPLLLRTCLSLEISLINLLRGESIGQEVGIDKELPSTSYEARYVGTATGESLTVPINWKDEKSVTRVEERLRAALREDPPSSLTKLSKELRCAKNTLRKEFPALVAQIARNSNDYYRPSLDREEVLQKFRAASEESPPPSLTDVSRRLGKGASTTTLNKKFPEESRIIVERYSAHCKRRLENDFIEKHLRRCLERFPPPSMREVSHEIGVAAPVIYSKFPVLYGAISNRSKMYRRERDRLNLEKAKADIQSICERAIKAGFYPDFSWVRSQLTVPCRSETFSRIRRDVIENIRSKFD